MSQSIPMYSDTMSDAKNSDAELAESPLSYRKGYLAELVDEIPSELGTVHETRAFIRRLLQYRALSPDATARLCDQLLWTGEELHDINRDGMIREMQEHGLTPSQAEHISKDILDVRRAVHDDSQLRKYGVKTKGPRAAVITRTESNFGHKLIGIVIIALVAFGFYHVMLLMFGRSSPPKPQPAPIIWSKKCT